MAKVIYSEIDNNPLFSGLAEVLPDISIRRRTRS